MHVYPSDRQERWMQRSSVKTLTNQSVSCTGTILHPALSTDYSAAARSFLSFFLSFFLSHVVDPSWRNLNQNLPGFPPPLEEDASQSLRMESRSRSTTTFPYTDSFRPFDSDNSDNSSEMFTHQTGVRIGPHHPSGINRRQFELIRISDCSVRPARGRYRGISPAGGTRN